MVSMKLRVAILSLLVVTSASSVLATSKCGSQNSLRLLRDKSPDALNVIEKEWALADANRDTTFLNCIFANEFQIASLNDFEVHYKTEVLQWVSNRTGSAELEKLQVRALGSAAAARGVYKVRRDGKLLSRFQFTDFFLYRAGRWQAFARALSPLPVQ
jgi:hypothetical protein